jgi:twitching motility protein PilT
MSLVDSLISAILRTDGEALVLHVGEKPYVVTTAGNVEISARELTLEAVTPMLGQLLSSGSQSQLDEFGAVEDQLQTTLAPEGERFGVVAARGGEDIWIEIRRQRPAPAVVAEEPRPEVIEEAPAAPPEPVVSLAEHEVEAEPEVAEPAPPDVPCVPEEPPHVPERVISRPTLVPPPVRESSVAPSVDVDDDAAVAPPTPAVVVPLRRPAAERPRGGEEGTELERLLRIASDRRATALYVVSGAKPSLRVDGEVRPLDTERTLAIEDVEALVLAMMPDGLDAVRHGTEADWVRDLPEVGRVRCTRFRDHRGPGAIFQLIGARVMSADELGLPRTICELSEEHEGLVLITGPRASGKSTLFAALIDLINRTRSAHIVTLESQIKFVHESRQSIVSQREVRGDHEAVLAMVRTALREAPDVLAIEDLRSREVVALALQAAESGQLVIGSVPAPTAVGALERVVDQTADDRRGSVLRAMSDTLRGVVAQVLLRKIRGGRVAARELLRNTHSVATLIAEDNLAQLPRAMEHGRRLGMLTFNESLLELVRDKTVDVREAYRHAPDRDAFVKILEREGIDTSFAERMA